MAVMLRTTMANVCCRFGPALGTVVSSLLCYNESLPDFDVRTRAEVVELADTPS